MTFNFNLGSSSFLNKTDDKKKLGMDIKSSLPTSPSGSSKETDISKVEGLFETDSFYSSYSPEEIRLLYFKKKYDTALNLYKFTPKVEQTAAPAQGALGSTQQKPATSTFSYTSGSNIAKGDINLLFKDYQHAEAGDSMNDIRTGKSLLKHYRTTQRQKKFHFRRDSFEDYLFDHKTVNVPKKGTINVDTLMESIKLDVELGSDKRLSNIGSNGLTIERTAANNIRRLIKSGIGEIMFYDEIPCNMDLNEEVQINHCYINVSKEGRKEINNRARVALCGVWPMDPVQLVRRRVYEDHKAEEFSLSLKRYCSSKGLIFKEYDNATGEFVFDVDNFNAVPFIIPSF